MMDLVLLCGVAVGFFYVFCIMHLYIRGGILRLGYQMDFLSDGLIYGLRVAHIVLHLSVTDVINFVIYVVPEFGNVNNNTIFRSSLL